MTQVRAIVVGATAIFALAPATVSACLGPMLETRSFLVTLPPEAMERPVVARVRVEDQDETTNDAGQTVVLTSVTVVETLAGEIEAGHTITVSALATTCSRERSVQPDKTYFIAGEMAGDVFTGEWRDWLWQ